MGRMAAPDQFFASGYPIASAAAGVRALADATSRLPRVELAGVSAGVKAFADAASGLSRVELAGVKAFADALPADFASASATVPLPRVTLVPPGGMTMEAPAPPRKASRWQRLKRGAGVVAFAWLYLAVPAETVDRAAGWATVIALLVLLRDGHKYP
jgi:hypothetical protein